MSVPLFNVLSKSQKNLLILIVDIVLFLASFSISMYVVSPSLRPLFSSAVLTQFIGLFVMIKIAILLITGLYSFLWRYVSIKEAVLVMVAMTASSSIGALVNAALKHPVALNVLIVDWAFSIILIGGWRLSLRVLRIWLVQPRAIRTQDDKQILIIGAGDAGEMLLREINKNRKSHYNVVGFLDDDYKKINQKIHGIRVLGAVSELEEIASKREIDEVFIAIPSASGRAIRAIVDQCLKVEIPYRITQGLYDIFDNKMSLDKLREVQIQDLLRREPIELDLSKIEDYIKNETILVTGGGGSIGSEICMQLCRFRPKNIVVLDHCEYFIYQIQEELKAVTETLKEAITITPVVADIKQPNRINQVMAQYKPGVIFHAAAYKHVPLMEGSPHEAVYNNILGTRAVIESAKRYNVKRFVMISTDKAVNPTNCMGASKRICELLVQANKGTGSTVFSIVRFGNVLGSRGSVVPLFQKQIQAGGPITITHPDITRYFMTIPEAASLVIQAGGLDKDGGLYVLDMGDPIKIVDLANDMIKLSGLRYGKDIGIEYIGLRPGEKMHEELFYDQSALSKTMHKKIFSSPIAEYRYDEVNAQIEALCSAVENSESGAVFGLLAGALRVMQGEGR